MEAREAVDIAVAIFQIDPSAEDASILDGIVECGIERTTALRLLQFIPVAFTRYLFRASGVGFADNYVLVSEDGRPVAERPIRGEPFFLEAWSHCERAAIGGAKNDYFEPIAARSGGYRAIRQMLQVGFAVDELVTTPPQLRE